LALLARSASATTCSNSAAACLGQVGASDSMLMQTTYRSSKVDKETPNEQMMLTTWSSSPTAVVGSACGFAPSAGGGLEAASATSPYIGRRAYCVAEEDVYAGGQGCGACFRLTRPGRPSYVVQVVHSSGVPGVFSCHAEAVEKITGSRSAGALAVASEPTSCNVASEGAVATVLGGDSPWHVTAIFSNLPYPVSSAEVVVGGTSFSMSRRMSSAVWSTRLDGKTGVAATFELTLQGNTTVKFHNCFEQWPVPAQSICMEELETPSSDGSPEFVDAATTTAVATVSDA